MRRGVSIILTLAIGAWPCAALAQNRRGAAKAPQMGERPGVVRGDEITPAQQAAVERGLERLASRQQRDGSFGQTLPTLADAVTSLVDWAPTASRADQFLYNVPFDGLLVEGVRGIYLASTAQTDGGTQLVPTSDTGSPLYQQFGYDPTTVHDLEWLPDGSGFLFIESYVYVNLDDPDAACMGLCADVFKYDLATGTVTQVTRLAERKRVQAPHRRIFLHQRHEIVLARDRELRQGRAAGDIARRDVGEQFRVPVGARFRVGHLPRQRRHQSRLARGGVAGFEGVVEVAGHVRGPTSFRPHRGCAK